MPISPYSGSPFQWGFMKLHRQTAQALVLSLSLGIALGCSILRKSKSEPSSCSGESCNVQQSNGDAITQSKPKGPVPFSIDDVSRIISSPIYNLVWEDGEADSYRVFLSNSYECDAPYSAESWVSGTSLNIVVPDDGIYFACVFAVRDQNQRDMDMPALNNALKLTFDRTAPIAFTDRYEFYKGGAFEIPLTIAERTRLKYHWEKVSGPGELIFTDNSVVKPSIYAKQDGDYGVRVTLTDETGAASTVDFLLHWDTTAPVAVLSGYPIGTDTMTTKLNITVAGDQVAYYRYKVGPAAMTDCFDAEFYSLAMDQSAKITDDISAIPNGDMKICVVGIDLTGNEQAYLDSTKQEWNKQVP